MNDQTGSSLHGRWSGAHTLVVAGTLLAAFLRIWRLGSLPPQAWYDEIWFALRARELLQGAPLVAHYGLADTAGNAGLVYWTALVRLLGIDSMAGARVVSALAGIVTVPLAYACCRELFRADLAAGRRLLPARVGAALVALILAVLPVMVILGRVGMEPAMAPPAALFCVWQVRLGLRRARPIHWALAGLVAGLAQYNGPHARFILPLLALVILDGLWARYQSRRNPAPTRPLGGHDTPRSGDLAGGFIPSRRAADISGVRHILPALLGVALLSIVGIVVCLPLILTFTAHPDWFYGRAEAVSAGISLPENVLRVVGAFNIAGDLNARQNVPGIPMLDGVLGIGFIVGLVWCLLRVRRSALARLLPVWLILMAIPAALTGEAPNFNRMIGVAPPAAALAVVGWDALLGWLMARRWAVETPRLRADLAVVALGLAALSLGWNIELVFGGWARSPELADAFTTASVRTARDLAARARTGQVVYVDRLAQVLDEPAFAYTFAGTTIRRVDLRECVPLLADAGRSAAYVFLPEDDGGGPAVLDSYKHLDWSRLAILWGRKARLAVTRGGLQTDPSLKGPYAYFAPGVSLLGSRIAPAGELKPGGTLRVRLNWQIETNISSNLQVFVHLFKPDSAMLAPAAAIDRAPCGESYPSSEWHPGEVIASVTPLQLPADLPAGIYEIAVGWVDPSTGLRSLLVSADSVLPENRAVIGRITVSQ